MPINKNALIRYRIIDECLSDPNRHYSRLDLTERVNSVLQSIDPELVLTKRTIEKDILALQERPFDLEIIEETVNGKNCLRYADQTKTLFSKPFSRDEKILLKEVLNTLGQFSGLDNFEWISKLQDKLNDSSFSNPGMEDQRTIISFSKNPYLNNLEDTQAVKNYLSLLFTAISAKISVKVDYKKFDGPMSNYLVYPYLLKQYNDRWYLICGLSNTNRDFIMNLPLDRMFSVHLCPEEKFQECVVDLEERFSQIVGVTYRNDLEEETIVFAAGNEKSNYIRTKPIHESQKEYSRDDQAKLHEEHPALSEYTFFEVTCIPNNELKTLLFSFDKDIVVLSPKAMKDEMVSELSRLRDLYNKV